jgi:hypothetical protein
MFVAFLHDTDPACTGGTGTTHRMPEGIEYLHCVQMALDATGLRYQVLDTDGLVKERLAWPAKRPASQNAVTLPRGVFLVPVSFPTDQTCIVLRFIGRAYLGSQGVSQTLLSTHRAGELAPLWIGLRGPEQRLTAIVHHEAGRSPHYWLGPCIRPGNQFDMEIMLHSDMGPGGIMCRVAGDRGWTSMSAASPWGLERLNASREWSVGYSSEGAFILPFMGTELAVTLAW